MNKLPHRHRTGPRFPTGGRGAATLLLSASCLAGAMACQPSNAAANPPPGKATVDARPVERPKPDRESATEPDRSERQEVPDYVLDFEPRANPFAPPEPGPLDKNLSGREAWAAEVKLNGLMTSESGMMAAVLIDGTVHLVRAGASFRSERGGGELRIVEIRASDIVVEQGGVKRIVSLPHP
ncbi:MAG: hypothetical protein IID33_15390 [Planctomycetes bacterium]|nr:hypothetical protein [Planctomycetota bacterium]